jgi:hypothetical protein
MGGYIGVADESFCYIPVVEHQSMLVPVAPAPHLMISIEDTSCECIIHRAMTIDTIHQQLYYIFGGGCLPIQNLDDLSFKSTSILLCLARSGALH